MGRLRWSNSLHSQIKAVFSAIKAIGVSKAECPKGHIRSIGTFKAYQREAHSFGKFLQRNGVNNLRDTSKVEKLSAKYLSERLEQAIKADQSIQTQETRSAALSGLERAFNEFFAQRGLSDKLDFSSARREYLAISRAYLGSGREYAGGTRSYPAPDRLVAALSNETHRLQATLQYQGGLRAEGVGAPSGSLKNPLTKDNLRGLGKDPVTGSTVGRIEVREKGGKWTVHYIPAKSYAQLEAYIKAHGSLQSQYREYRDAIIEAAKATGQYSPGRGTHGLKTSFAHARYLECVKHGSSHEQALQQVALELAHNRADVTLIYTKG